MTNPSLCRVVAASLAGLVGAPALAIDRIPEQAGWSGFVLPGVGYMDLKSNTVAGNSFIDVGIETISSLDDSPASSSDLHAILTGEVRYTLSGGQTQFFLGSSIEDLVTLDLSQGLGVRRNIGQAGVVEVTALNSGVVGEVWQDPYVIGESRVDTDRESSGVRFRWDRIFGSEFEFEAAFRNVDVQDERSGEFLGLGPEDRDLLRRDADFTRFGLTWRHRLSGSTTFSPEIRFLKNDADGNAESYDGYAVHVTWIYVASPFTVVGTVGYTDKSFDAANPIYDRKRDSTTGLASATVSYRLPTASQRWSVAGILTYADEDSDINFHDTTVLSVIGAVQYRFGN